MSRLQPTHRRFFLHRPFAVAAVLATVLVSGFVPARAHAKVFLSGDEALELAFPGCDIDRQTVFLTDEQRTEVEKRASSKLDTSIVHPYVATCEGKPGGTAYFDKHRVRTLPEALMIVVDPEGRIGRIEVLAFNEPEDYLPRGAWYDQFKGKKLSEELALKKDIRGISGATLTARATTEAARRVLALHAVLGSTDQDAKKPQP